MTRSRTEPAITPASGEAPASIVSGPACRKSGNRPRNAPRRGGRGAGLLTGGQAGRKRPILDRALTECREKATSESSVSQNWTFCARRTVHRHAVAKETELAIPRESQPISYSLLVAFCYRHLPPPDRNGARPPDHGFGSCARRTRCGRPPVVPGMGQRLPGRILKYDAFKWPRLHAGCPRGARELRPACGRGVPRLRGASPERVR